MQQLIYAARSYGIYGALGRLELGAEYYHDKVKALEAENYIMPFLRLYLTLSTEGLCRFFQMVGHVREYSYRSLTKLHPYRLHPVLSTNRSVDSNGRFGIGASNWLSNFDYRAYAGFSSRDNHLHWYRADVVQWSVILAAGLTKLLLMAPRTVLS